MRVGRSGALDPARNSIESLPYKPSPRPEAVPCLGLKENEHCARFVALRDCGRIDAAEAHGAAHVWQIGRSVHGAQMEKGSPPARLLTKSGHDSRDSVHLALSPAGRAGIAKR